MKITDLPANMQNKIVTELCPAAGLDFCWAWTGAVQSRGYGCVGVNRRSQLTHRVSYELLVGPIEVGLQIDHLCRNKRCCNPAHLEPVTAKTNMERTDRAEKTHCVHGHPLSGDTLIIKNYASGLTKRNCRECHKQRLRKCRARIKASAA